MRDVQAEMDSRGCGAGYSKRFLAPKQPPKQSGTEFFSQETGEASCVRATPPTDTARQEAEKTSSLDRYDAGLETMGCQKVEFEEENFKELLESPLTQQQTNRKAVLLISIPKGI